MSERRTMDRIHRVCHWAKTRRIHNQKENEFDRDLKHNNANMNFNNTSKKKRGNGLQTKDIDFILRDADSWENNGILWIRHLLKQQR